MRTFLQGAFGEPSGEATLRRTQWQQLNSHFYQFVICFTNLLKKNQRPALTLVAMIATFMHQLNTNTTDLANFRGE
ncbi:MAG TPA: hypothetical protein VGG17_11145 [Acidimicrobiales bacterium]|jgi:hypothetical protein